MNADTVYPPQSVPLTKAQSKPVAQSVPEQPPLTTPWAGEAAGA